MEITLHNRQRKLILPLARLRSFAKIALRESLGHIYRPGQERAVLCALPEVEVSFVSDATIAKVHQRFMAIPGATDVITFDHGEILIGVGVARDNAPLYGHSFEEELALYIVHGLLHLNGYKDKDTEDAAVMHQLQEQILCACLAELAREEPNAA